ncbi:MAG: signal peptidase I [Clostridia bacterium]|nr:signal peptidase I [Clostridia bacterium]
MIEKFLNFIISCVVVLTILFILLTFGVKLVGLHPYIVSSGSMEPNFHVGSLVYAKEVDCRTLQPGDAISFSIGNDTMVTHRIYEVKYEDNSPVFITKGDANNVVDAGQVHKEQIVGKVVMNLPYLGYIIELLKTTKGKIIAIGFALILFLSLKLCKVLKNGQ